LGFAAAGIAPALATSYEQEFRDWLAAGKHGSMEWLTELLAERLDVRRMLPGARAVLVVADAYATPADGSSDAPIAPGSGRIARYARGRDYHAVVKRRLHRLADRLRGAHPGAEFRAFVDTGPALEREHAARAGIGWIGKHTLLINPESGSWFVLGGIATTLHLLPDPDRQIITDHCGSCTRCIDACPTQAITPYSVDAQLCISYLTIEHEGPIDSGLHASMGDRLIGCDICQDVCPFNAATDDRPRHGLPGREPAAINPAYASSMGVGPSLPLLNVLSWSEADRTGVMSSSAAKRATLIMLKRNAVIAAANAIARGQAGTDAAALRARIAEIAADPTEALVLRETAQSVLEELSRQP
jgi:epoxyqueuosine reductase